ncbi:MAG: ABC transporter ATP-binding protein [Promethearchaeota archaeon]
MARWILISENNLALFFKDFSFIYGTDKNQKPAVSNINFKLNEGDILILAGPSGSGKSTISYAMNGIIPWRLKGLMKGDVKIFGKSIWDYRFMELSKLVGLVKQNPLEQLITFTVRDEIAFGLENLKYPKREIEEKVEDITRFMKINSLLDREVDQLSGGQKQLVILSSFLVMDPKILILDEPIAFLDQNSESLLLDRLKKLVKSFDYSLTLIIIEHRLSRVIDFANKIVVLDENGTIKLQGDISDILKNNFDTLKTCNVRVPWITNIFNEFNKNYPEFTKKVESQINFQHLLNFIDKLDLNSLKKLEKIVVNNEIQPKGFDKFDKYEEKIEFYDLYIESQQDKLNLINLTSKSKNSKRENSNNIILEVKNLSFEYPNSGIKAINNLSLQITEGDFIGLIGPNGSGKTTLLYLLAYLYEPTSGQILFRNKDLSNLNPYDYARKIGFIFQNPENMIFKPTIKEEILYGPNNFGILNEISEKYLSKLIDLIGNEDPDKNPYNLSWGQKRRLNLSSIFVYDPDIILLDEPFIGQDQRTIDSLIETLYIENKRGKTIIISSHDYHLLLKYTRKIIELNKNGTLRDYDSNGNYFKRHKTLGPIICLNKIKEKISGVS